MFGDLLESTVDYYRRSYLAHGDSAAGMDWKDRASQTLRFDVIARHMDFSGRPSVLDVGCGNGEFLQHCRERGLGIRYLGADVCPEMVAACRRRFGDDAAVEASAHEIERVDGAFDYVIASGSFNAKRDATPEAWRRYFEACLAAMHRKCSRALIVNMMTGYVDFEAPHLYYVRPAALLDFVVAHLGRRFVLDHSYPLWEMTLVVAKDAPAPAARRAS
ncbi:MAG TPA: class I SAM-dependent methyltransferase [Planctomycetota bacterium]|nr:class I SAM-dependent methyltransferase [Planctomycetota bacterium]